MSWPVLIVAALIVFAFFVLVVTQGGVAMRRPHATGTESLVGTTGVVVSPLRPQGQVRLHGETWRARTEGGDLLKDGPVEVLRTEGLTLIVRRLGEPDSGAQEKRD